MRELLSVPKSPLLVSSLRVSRFERSAISNDETLEIERAYRRRKGSVAGAREKGRPGQFDVSCGNFLSIRLIKPY